MIVMKAYFLEGKVTFHESTFSLHIVVWVNLVDVGCLATKDRVPVRH